jgi:hypothetical protein
MQALSWALTMYALTFLVLVMYKPLFMFTEEGSPRELGTGQDETLLPVHFAATLAGFIAYAKYV